MKPDRNGYTMTETFLSKVLEPDFALNLLYFKRPPLSTSDSAFNNKVSNQFKYDPSAENYLSVVVDCFQEYRVPPARFRKRWTS